MVFNSKKKNYIFRPIAAIFRLLQFCKKSIIYMPILWGHWPLDFPPNKLIVTHNDDEISTSPRNIGIYVIFLSKIVITWRLSLLAETCSYFFAIKHHHTIHTTIVVFSWLIFTSPLFLYYARCEFCRKRPVWRSDHSFTGVLLVVCVCVCVYDLETSKWEDHGPIRAVMPHENVVRRTYREN